MDGIYQRASCVIAWIGRDKQAPASDGEINRPVDIESAIDFVKLLFERYQLTQYYNRYLNKNIERYYDCLKG
jgi:hypothetical protein